MKSPSLSFDSRGDMYDLNSSLTPKPPASMNDEGMHRSQSISSLMSTTSILLPYGSSDVLVMMLMVPLRPSSAAKALALPQSYASSLSNALCHAMDERERMPGFSLRLLMPSRLVIVWLSFADTSPK